MNNPIIYLIKKIWLYAEGKRKRIVSYVTLSFIASLVGLLDPLIIGTLLNKIQSSGINSGNILHILSILCILPLIEIIFWSLHGPSRVLEMQNAFFVRANYKNFLLSGTMALPIEWQVDHHSGDTIDKIEKGTQALFTFSCRTFDIIKSVTTLLVALIVMLSFNLTAGSTAIFVSIITLYVLLQFDKRIIPGYKTINKKENIISAKIFDTLSNITTVIILRIEHLVLKNINAYIQKPYDVYNKTNKINEIKWFFASFFGKTIIVLVIGIYIFSELRNGVVLAGTIYILYGYANQIQSTFYRFAYLYNDIVRYRTSVANTEELSNDFKEILDSHEKRLPLGWGTVEINNLSFSYRTQDNASLHLDDVSMKIKKGERIALIGESGGGKSTFLKILRDLYHPKTFSIKVDGKEEATGFNSFSDSISLIPQDPEIFSTTIRENITLGVEYSEEYLERFTTMACFTEVIKQLPNGLESSIVEKGVNLSGGEKQRLALSRGLLASTDKEIILLDEPTSSVDFHNELAIYKNIFDAFPEKTIISSIHRLHLLSLFDSVYFFKDGKIIASGSFEELKNTSQEFATLWEKYIHTRDGEATS